MRRFTRLISILVIGCLPLTVAAPAESKEAGKSCNTLRRVTVWSIDAKQGYLILIDELERQYVVSCDDVRRRGAASKKPSRIQAGDTVTVRCHALR